MAQGKVKLSPLGAAVPIRSELRCGATVALGLLASLPQ